MNNSTGENNELCFANLKNQCRFNPCRRSHTIPKQDDPCNFRPNHNTHRFGDCMSAQRIMQDSQHNNTMIVNKNQESQSTNMVNTQSPQTQPQNNHQQVNKPIPFPDLQVIQPWEHTNQDI